MRRRWRGVAIFGAIALTLCAGAALASGGDKDLGAYLAGECTGCHQVSGQSSGRIPAIVALPEDHFIEAMVAYRERVRDHQVMQTIAGQLTDEEIAALAAYFGSIPMKNVPH
jgi:cytochrome c